jgi:nucleoside-triphosphatase THEP1
MIQLYKAITESYENDNLDILMIEAYKIFIKPKKVIGDQIEILENSKKSYHEKIKTILESQAYAWAKFDDALKENFLINLMKQSGVNFVDKEKVREVLNRKIINRKVGQKPKNNLRMRVKNKK